MLIQQNVAVVIRGKITVLLFFCRHFKLLLLLPNAWLLKMFLSLFCVQGTICHKYWYCMFMALKCIPSQWINVGPSYDDDKVLVLWSEAEGLCFDGGLGLKAWSRPDRLDLPSLTPVWVPSPGPDNRQGQSLIGVSWWQLWEGSRGGERVGGRGQGSGAVKYQTPLSNPVCLDGTRSQTGFWISNEERATRPRAGGGGEEERGRTGPLRPQSSE